MPEHVTDRHEILVIGAGPAGLLAACELARYGVVPRIVERRLLPHHQARATAIQPQTKDFERQSISTCP